MEVTVSAPARPSVDEALAITAAAMSSIAALRLAVMDVFESWKTGFAGPGTRPASGPHESLFITIIQQRKKSIDDALDNFRQSMLKVKELPPVSPNDFPYAVNLFRRAPEPTRVFAFEAVSPDPIARSHISVATLTRVTKMAQDFSLESRFRDRTVPASPLLPDMTGGSIDELLPKLTEQYPKLIIGCDAKPGSGCQISIECPNTFVLILGLSAKSTGADQSVTSWQLDRLNVLGCDERPDSRLWATSKHDTFRKWVLICRAVFAALQQNQDDFVCVLASFTEWISHFDELFQTPCSSCRRILFHDSDEFGFVPPLFRTLDKLRPYHPQCYHDFRT